MTLADEMNASLPICAYPVREMIHSATGLKLTPDTVLEIVKVYDGGQISGILCTVSLGGETLTLSLTYLDFSDDLPLKGNIDEYKKNRIGALQAGHPVPGRNNNKPPEKKPTHANTKKACKRCFG